MQNVIINLDKIMKKQKKYFKSPYVKGNEEYLHNEFSEKLPLDGLFEDDKEVFNFDNFFNVFCGFR